MMQIGGLTLLKKRTWGYTIASWHNQKSISWRWLLIWHGRFWFTFHTQKPMWRKDYKCCPEFKSSENPRIIADLKRAIKRRDTKIEELIERQNSLRQLITEKRWMLFLLTNTEAHGWFLPPKQSDE